MIKNIVFYLTFFLVVNSCSYDEKVNRIHSRSIEESKESDFFVHSYELEPIEGEKCVLVDNISCWSEKGWKFKYGFLFNAKKIELDFYNVFLDIQNGSKNDVEYLHRLDNKWNNTSFVIEPKLGNYFQVKNLNDSIYVRINNLSRDCIYYLKVID